MTSTRAHRAEDLSDALYKSLPTASPSVDRYRNQGVWDQAVLEALAIFASTVQPLPSDVRQMVQETIEDPNVSPKFRGQVIRYLVRIP